MCVCYPIVLYRICCSVSCNSVCKCLLVFRFKLPHSPYMSAFEWHFTIHYFTLHRIVVRIFCFIFFSLFHLHLQTFCLSLSRLPFVCILFAFFFLFLALQKKRRMFSQNLNYAQTLCMHTLLIWMRWEWHSMSAFIYMWKKERIEDKTNSHWSIGVCVCLWMCECVLPMNSALVCWMLVSFSPPGWCIPPWAIM